MLLSDTAASRARTLSAIAASLAVTVAAAAYFGMHDGGWSLLVPVLAAAAATLWPNRNVVATAMVITAAVVYLGFESTGVLFAATLAALMLALNNLQSAATQLRRRSNKPLRTMWPAPR